MKRFYILLFVFMWSSCFRPLSAQKKDSLLKLLSQSQSDSSRIYNLFELANTLYLVNPDTTIIICNQILGLGLKTQDLKSISESYGWLGYLYTKIGKIDKALQYDFKAAKFSHQIGEKESEAMIYNNIAIIYNDKGDNYKALKYYQKSLEIHKEIKNKKGMSVIYNNIAYLFNKLGKVSEATAYWMKDLKLQTEINYTKGLATTYGNLGILYSQQANYTKALKCFTKSYKIHHKDSDIEGEAASLTKIADIFFTLKDTINSFHYYNKSFNLYKKMNNKAGMAELYIDLSNFKRRKHKLDSALIFANRALLNYSEIVDKNGIASALFSKAEIYMQLKKFNKAKSDAQLAYFIALKLGYPLLISKIAKLMHHLYLKLNNYKSALKFYSIEIAMRDSLINKKNYQELINQQANFDYEKQAAVDSIAHRKEIELKNIALEKSQNENKARNMEISIVFFAFILVCLFFIWSLINYRQKNRAFKILSEQKEELHQQNEEIKVINSKLLVEQAKLSDAHTNITENITSAIRIQNAALPSPKFFSQYFSDYFIYYKPLMQVSGDFYWAKAYKNFLLFAVADCTGHGIPGAFVSMLGISFLNEIYYKKELHTASEILEILRVRIKESLNYTATDHNLEGMDISFCVLNIKNLELQFSGAYNPLYIIPENNRQELEIIEADKQPIGKYFKETPFTNHKRQLQKGDKLFLFSDGYRDQFRADGLQKFKTTRFKKLLIKNSSKSMKIQRECIDKTFLEWKKESSQIDDITILGVEV